MGEVYADEERYPEAIAEYQAALAKRPDAQGMHYAIAVAYWAQQRMELAEKAFKDAWNENPNDALTNLYLGDIAVHDQRFSEALRFLLVAQRGQPICLKCTFCLGNAIRAKRNPKKQKLNSWRQSKPTRRLPNLTIYWRRFIVSCTISRQVLPNSPV